MNRHISRTLMAFLPPEIIRRVEYWTALRVFRHAAGAVPAYQDFLARMGVNPRRVWTIDDFRALVPLCDKHTYQKQYPIAQLCRGGRIEDKYTLERSSGHSGAPCFWLRSPGEDAQLRDHTELLFRDLFDAHRVPTLVVVTWSQGTWVTGETFARNARQLAAARRLKMTVVSPGIRLDETIEILEHFLPLYPQTVIAGYPPFLKDLIDRGAARGLDWPRHRVHLFSGGEGFPENWRTYMARRLGFTHVGHRAASRILSAYGSADTGISAGGETVFSLLVRRLAAEDSRLCRALFGGQVAPPSVFQYDPTRYYVESVDGELVFTCISAMPLVRYNIHDRGGAYSYPEFAAILHDHGYCPKQLLRDAGWPPQTLYPLPLFYVSGRSDGTTTIYGVNIYTEDVHHALCSARVAGLHTGEFRLSTTFTADAEQELGLRLRIRPESEPSPALMQLIRRHIVESLCHSNTEYRHLHEMKGGRVEPIVELTHQPLAPAGNGLKNRYH